VRVGDTVRRPVGPRSDFVHELLLFLERAGFDGAPRFLGLDERGREVLSFLPGEPLPGTANLTDGQIVSAAGLLRRYHDAAVPFAGDAETVVHGDPGPWNVLWLGEGAAALVDFDEARPGPADAARISATSRGKGCGSCRTGRRLASSAAASPSSHGATARRSTMICSRRSSARSIGFTPKGTAKAGPPRRLRS
jgi:hypothetical protein